MSFKYVTVTHRRKPCTCLCFRCYHESENMIVFYLECSVLLEGVCICLSNISFLCTSEQFLFHHFHQLFQSSWRSLHLSVLFPNFLSSNGHMRKVSLGCPRIREASTTVCESNLPHLWLSFASSCVCCVNQ